MTGLKSIEQLLQTKELKLKKSADTRWLSVDNACQTLVKVLPAIITSLESEAADRGQALAHGLCKVVKQFKFIATLYMIYDVLPVVSHLSRIFQYPDIDLSVLQRLESTTIKELQNLKNHYGVQFRKLDANLKSLLSAFNISYRTLRGRDQREKCTLNVVKYTFQVKCTLSTTKSALTVQ